MESQHALIFLFEHDLRANAFSRLSRGKTGIHFFGSCSKRDGIGCITITL